MRRYRDAHDQLTTALPQLQQVVNHSVEGTVVGLRTPDITLLTLMETGLPAGHAHKVAEALMKVLRKDKSKLTLQPTPVW
jgi:hypothetical protein